MLNRHYIALVVNQVKALASKPRDFVGSIPTKGTDGHYIALLIAVVVKANRHSDKT